MTAAAWTPAALREASAAGAWRELDARPEYADARPPLALAHAFLTIAREAIERQPAEEPSR